MQDMTSYDPVINEVIDKYYEMVFKLAFARTKNRFDAEDVLQEVFLRYVRHPRNFKGEEHEKAWFLKVTINCSKNLFLSLSKNSTISLDENRGGVMDEEQILGEFLSQLPRKYRTVIHLFYYEDLKASEIANLLEIKESTVKVQLMRARRLLKGFMEMEDENV